MSGEKNLHKLIASMTPTLNQGVYVFVTLEETALQKIPRGTAICEFREEEGITLILERSKADSFNLQYDFSAAWITLSVHSALEAVGLTAAFATELARHNISCNVIAGYYHDHIFVAERDADSAIKVLEELVDTTKPSSLPCPCHTHLFENGSNHFHPPKR